MAKEIIINDGNETPQETPVVNETHSEEESVSKARAKTVTVTPTVKKVKIRAMEAVQCMIGGVQYALAKDKEYSVPADVAAVLCHAKKAYRL